MRRSATSLIAAALLAVPSCERGRAPGRPHTAGPASAASAGPWFEEVGSERGVRFVYQSGETGRYLLPSIMGGGVALLDIEGDGDLDIYFVQGGSFPDPPAGGERPANVLLANGGDGTFEDVTERSGTGDRGYGMGVACGDYDGDGDTDLYVTNFGPNVLYRNRGDGTFEDATREARAGHPGWSASAAFFDAEGDGDLDLFVTSYINWSPAIEMDCFSDMGTRDYCSPKNYEAPARDVLYRNEGDGTFTDATEASGIALDYGNGLGVTCADFDGDGHVDVFVANDGTADILWRNRGEGTFEDVALLAGCAFDESGAAKAGMGVDSADLDDDGDFDLVVCNLSGESDSLFLNDGSMFSDATARRGLKATSRPFTRFGVGFVDFDNDGVLDLYEANGRVMRQSVLYSQDPYAEPNLVFRGLPSGRFEEVLPRGATGTAAIGTSRAAAFGDLDGDGGIDAIVVNRDGPAHYLRNVVPERGRWISFRATAGGRTALHARLEIRIAGRTVTRQVRAAASYLASNDPTVHVGLGERTGVDSVAVRWPGGTWEDFGPRSAGRAHELAKGAGTPSHRGGPPRRMRPQAK